MERFLRASGTDIAHHPPAHLQRCIMLRQLVISAAMGASLAGCTASLDTDTGDRGQDNVIYRERYYDRYDRPRYGVEDNPRPSMAAIDAGVAREAREILNARENGNLSYQMPHP